MTNLEWLLSLPVEDIEKRYHSEECTRGETMTNLEWLRGVIATTNFEWIEWIKNLPEEELIRELSTVYNKEWLNAEHKEKLKPCANCGGKAKFFPYKSFNSSDTGCIRCIDCGMRTFTGQKFKVIEIWNRRIDDDKTSNRPK